MCKFKLQKKKYIFFKFKFFLFLILNKKFVSEFILAFISRFFNKNINQINKKMTSNSFQNVSNSSPCLIKPKERHTATVY